MPAPRATTDSPTARQAADADVLDVTRMYKYADASRNCLPGPGILWHVAVVVAAPVCPRAIRNVGIVAFWIAGPPTVRPIGRHIVVLFGYLRTELSQVDGPQVCRAIRASPAVAQWRCRDEFGVCSLTILLDAGHGHVGRPRERERGGSARRAGRARPRGPGASHGCGPAGTWQAGWRGHSGSVAGPRRHRHERGDRRDHGGGP